MFTRLTLALLLLSACGLRTRADGGEGGGTAGGSNGGGNGGSGGDGGGTAGGTTGPTFFATNPVSLPMLTKGGPIVGISGRAGDIYAVSEFGSVAHSTGGGFAEITGFPYVATNGIYVASDGSVFISQVDRLVTCTSACTSFSSYTTLMLPSVLASQAACGDAPDNVFAAVDDTAYTAGLYRWDGGTWASESPNLGLLRPRACALLPDHTVVVAGQADVIFYRNGTATPEHAAASLPVPTDQIWNGFAAVGSKMFVIGENWRIGERSSAGTWTVSPPGGPYPAYAIGGPTESEVFAGGVLQDGTTLRRYDGTKWALAPNPLNAASVHAIWVASPDEIYFGGINDSSRATIYKATR